MKNYVILFFLILSIFTIDKTYGQSKEQIQQLLDEGAGLEEKAKKTKTPKQDQMKVEKEVKVEAEKVDKVKAEKVAKVIPEKEVKEETKSLLQIHQETYTGGAKALLKNGDKSFYDGNTYRAVKYYTAALDKTKKKKLKGILNYKLGSSSFQVRDYPLSQKYFNEALTFPTKKKKFNDAKYYLALAYKHQANYIKAKATFKEFIQDAEGNVNLDYQRTKARLEVKGCDYALELIVEEPSYVVSNPGENVNGPFADFGPEIRQNELVYSKITSSSSDPTNETHEIAQLYSVEMYQDQYNYAQNFSSILNEGYYYVCNPNFTQDGKVIYFTRCSFDKQKNNNCAIFKSELEMGVWTNPLPLNTSINEENSNNSHPQIVQEDGREILYFTSDRASGKGGKDIWYAIKGQGSDFGPAINLGSPVNTKYDDLSPFYHAGTKTLYYSTDGKANLGGLDVFKSEKVEDGWLEPINMETPVNSSLDDYDFILDADGAFGFLVSNREGTTSFRNATCCDDIFEVRTTQINLSVKGLVYAENKDGRALVQKAIVTLKNLTNQTVEKISYDGRLFFAPLDKESDYVLSASNEDFEEVNLQFTTKDLRKSDTLQYDLFFKERKRFDDQVIGIIYYEYNQANLTPKAPKTLQEVIAFLKEYPKVKVEVNAHTDGNGDPNYNLELSKGRCEAAANYITFNGISKDRIIKNWYGESNPVASETMEDGSDNSDGRALNRRTEFKVKATN
jgi:outer membrane protein OmpA-like peptidoglycan-associated protein